MAEVKRQSETLTEGPNFCHCNERLTTEPTKQDRRFSACYGAVYRYILEAPWRPIKVNGELFFITPRKSNPGVVCFLPSVFEDFEKRLCIPRPLVLWVLDYLTGGNFPLFRKLGPTDRGTIIIEYTELLCKESLAKELQIALDLRAGREFVKAPTLAIGKDKQVCKAIQ